jgi:hypothetical protein
LSSFLAHVGERFHDLGLACAGGAEQQENAGRPLLGRQHGPVHFHVRKNGADRRRLSYQPAGQGGSDIARGFGWPKLGAVCISAR